VYFDIIYCYAFVHHIEYLDALFFEISRCLKRGGICRFLDDAYSPIWQLMKNTLIKTLQLCSHKKSGISPENLSATQKGSYRKGEIVQIVQIMQKFEFMSYLFERICFSASMGGRGIIKLFGGSDYLIRGGMPIMKGLDNWLTRESHFMRENLTRFIWEFDK